MAKLTGELNGKQVVYSDYSMDTWSYDGVDKVMVEKVNPQLADEVARFVQQAVEECKEKFKMEQYENRAKIITERVIKLEKFKSEIAHLVEGYNVGFNKPENVYNTVESVMIQKNGTHATVEYDPTVMRSGDWHSHKTDKVWVRSFDYKKIRFASLEGAIKNAIKCIDEKNEKNAQRVKAVAKEQEKIQTLEEKLKEHGIGFKVDSHWHTDAYRRGHGYESKTNMAEVKVNDTITVRALVGESEGAVNMGVITITGKYTIEQFNKVVNLVKEMI